MKDFKMKSRKSVGTYSVDKKQSRKIPTKRNKRPNSVNIIRNNISRFNCDLNMYSKKIVTDLMYDERKHIVSVFKEYLILDDIAEFLER
jgi:hypothetical protein